jgi:hypothetical protein
MNELVGPFEVEKLLKDITIYWKESTADEKDKRRILQLLLEYYEARNITELDVVVGNLIRGVLAQEQQLELFNEKN